MTLQLKGDSCKNPGLPSFDRIETHRVEATIGKCLYTKQNRKIIGPEKKINRDALRIRSKISYQCFSITYTLMYLVNEALSYIFSLSKKARV